VNDGLDNDCDGEIDEDFWPEDQYWQAPQILDSSVYSIY